ncbi:prephenate dehydrogenase [Nocardioides coralli]|uniref:prephenate dehydrogenase n=1 Tax=Nocardioides coralli TaxID=2872154 RepID=UPI001CA45749|nr:prephenate dehydrogenase [Nocardioides coralli]QZY30590.1 prephenate dehydrogenase [Nocardioides coralli]
MSDLLRGPVEVVGAGLLGTSIGLACRRAGVQALLRDTSAENLRTATGLGAGRVTAEGDRPQLVVVAVPPDQLGSEVVAALRRTDAVVTDVGSIKSAPLQVVAGEVAALAGRYVGGHPMAGSERSGPLAASAALFDGRPWAVTPHGTAPEAAVELVEELARACGAVPVRLDPDEHDRAVARTSHLPHLLAVLVAGRLADAPEAHLALSGQGVRDVTRIAAGDPLLWQQIVTLNADALAGLLEEVAAELGVLRDAVVAGDRAVLGRLLSQGVAGTRAIPGKHGGPLSAMGSVYVSVPDHPGELARLFADAGAVGVNIEDIHIDHDPGRPVGLVELVVDEARTELLLESLESRGWVTHR